VQSKETPQAAEYCASVHNKTYEKEPPQGIIPSDGSFLLHYDSSLLRLITIPAGIAG